MNEQENFIPDASEEMELRLWEYIDGLADENSRSKIEILIRENLEWKNKYSELLEIHSSLNLVELEQPSLRFTKNVMEEIGRLQIAPAAKNYINSRIIYGIGAFFLTVILAFLVYAIAQIKWEQASDNSSVLGFDLTRVDYSIVFNNSFVNLFMMLNVILGLLLFDRYLNARKEKYLKGSH